MPAAQALEVLPVRDLADPSRAWARIREICCETALAGKALPDEARWPFFGEYWIGPYERYLPEWTFAAVSGGVPGHGDRSVCGYITLCPDTRTFQRMLRWRFYPGLYLRVLLGRFAWTLDARNTFKRYIGLLPSPESLFPPALLARVYRDYAAHLHMNLDASSRGSGAGRRLCDAAMEKLIGCGVPGIHLFCGDAPVGFYIKNGFEILHSVEWKPGVKVHLMVRDLCKRGQA